MAECCDNVQVDLLMAAMIKYDLAHLVHMCSYGKITQFDGHRQLVSLWV